MKQLRSLTKKELAAFKKTGKLPPFTSVVRWRVLLGKRPVVLKEGHFMMTGSAASWDRAFYDYVKAHNFLESIRRSHSKMEEKEKKATAVHMEHQVLMRFE